MFSLLQFFIGVYLLYCAVTGKGKVLENEFLKVPREEYVKKLRILAAISGTVLTVSSGLEYAGVIVPGSTLGWISWGVGFASILPMMIYSSRSTDREAAKANQAATAQSAAPKKDPLRAAFVFDDEEAEADKPTDPGK